MFRFLAERYSTASGVAGVERRPGAGRMAAGVVLLALVALAWPVKAWSCDCFSPEMRLKTAKDTLALAHLAAFGQVADVNPDGSAVFTVLEGFKGTEKGANIVIAPGEDGCARKRPKSSSKLLLAFNGPASACGVYEPDNFLVREFRILTAQ